MRTETRRAKRKTIGRHAGHGPAGMPSHHARMATVVVASLILARVADERSRLAFRAVGGRLGRDVGAGSLAVEGAFDASSATAGARLLSIAAKSVIEDDQLQFY